MPNGPTADPNNNRVTSAVLGTKLDHVISDLAAFRAEWQKCREEDRDLREALHGRVLRNEERIIRNEERIKSSTSILAGFQVILSVIAGAVGLSK